MSEFKVSLKLDANNPAHLSALNALLGVLGEADNQTTPAENAKKIRTQKPAIKPDEEVTESCYTTEQLRGKISEAVDAGVDRSAIRTKIKAFGADNVQALDPKFYNAFYVFLEYEINTLA